jgi:hypothetical protein|tara:strand:+ start:11138 stop:11338 length:201 start_codon:yes stop_codon:yes gene_type:complete
MRIHDEPEWIFPFEAMGIGESFFIPTLKTAQAIYAIESGAKRAKVKVKIFVVRKDGCMGVRCWRLL